MKLAPLAIACAAVLACGALSAAEGGANNGGKHPDAAAAERASVTGTVTEVNAEKKSFVLKDDASGKTEPYRPFYAGGKVDDIVAKIATLKAGDHLTVVYTVREGRR